MGGRVIPPKVHTMGQPRVDVTDECICQVTGLPEVPPVQLSGHVVLPILQEDGYPCPHCRAADTNVLKVGARGD